MRIQKKTVKEEALATRSVGSSAPTETILSNACHLKKKTVKGGIPDIESAKTVKNHPTAGDGLNPKKSPNLFTPTSSQFLIKIPKIKQ